MLKIVIYAEVPAVIASNQDAVSIMNGKAKETAMDIGMEIDGEPAISAQADSELMVIAWSVK